MFFHLLLLLQKILLILMVIPPTISLKHPHPNYPCKPPIHSTYTFCNTSLPISTRAQSLISLLNLPEKITQLTNNASSIPRLGIPAYEWWSESLHGIASNGPGVSFNGAAVHAATGFPQVLVTAASFNRSLWFSIAEAIAVEARAMYNVGQAGLSFWAPNINIFRDPRWGRGQETPGEDPMVASVYAVEYVKGFQGAGDDGGLMLSACCKHNIAYDLENWMSFSRYSFNAVVTEQDLLDTYQPPFQSCIQEGKASCLMCSYNAVNGVPACAKKDLLERARADWEFKGYITSDCDAVATIYEYQRYVASPEDAVAAVLKAGMDVNCGTYLLRNTYSAIKQRKVKEEEIDRALFNLFSVQLRLGIFNGNPQKGRFGKFGPRDVCSQKHRNLAREAARQGIVLLKNENKFLPLSNTKIASLGVIGPVANNSAKLGGDYTGISCNQKSYVDGFKGHMAQTFYAPGCFDVQCDSSDGFAEAIRIARMVDVAVVILGIDLTQETEDRDRVSLLLPGKQMELVAAIVAASERPLVLVLTGGGPLDVSFAKEDPRIGSIIWTGYPGEAGGQALAEIVFGKFNPGGRLPMTWYPESFTKVPMNDMRMRPDMAHGYPGRTYRFYDGNRVFGFGEGLSYTSYTYKFTSIPNRISLLGSSPKGHSENKDHSNWDGILYLNVDEVASSCNAMRFQVNISLINKGKMGGSHVVLLFSKPPRVFESVPLKQLIGFTRVHTAPKRATETSILVEPCKHLTVVDEHGITVLPVGKHILTLESLEHSIYIESN